MQRPVMDPRYVQEREETRRRGFSIRKGVMLGLAWFGRSLLTNPFAVRRSGTTLKVSAWKVLARTTVCWSILLPVLTGAVAVLLAFVGTHPIAPAVVTDPASQGCYFESVEFVSADGTHLNAWLVPAIDARLIVDEKDRLLRDRKPGIVLAHDFGRTPQQMLPWVRPLHDAGMVVLVVGLRGCGTGRPAAQTFGAHEAQDVQAGVDYLRGATLVDPDRIAVAGVGTGATAALIAASHDSRIKALVLADPSQDGQATVVARLAPHGRALGWLQPLCRKAFETLYGVDADELDFPHYDGLVKSRPTLLLKSGSSLALDDASTVERVKAFCRQQLKTRTAPRLGTARVDSDRS